MEHEIHLIRKGNLLDMSGISYPESDERENSGLVPHDFICCRLTFHANGTDMKSLGCYSQNIACVLCTNILKLILSSVVDMFCLFTSNNFEVKEKTIRKMSTPSMP